MQNWMDRTPWLPNLHSLDETIGFCRRVLIGQYQTTVIGNPVTGFISIDPDHRIAALYVSPTDQGTGTQLLEHAKSSHTDLSLWVFQANTDALRFYQRHGFTETGRTDGDNDEKLPDIQMAWTL